MDPSRKLITEIGSFGIGPKPKKWPRNWNGWQESYHVHTYGDKDC